MEAIAVVLEQVVKPTNAIVARAGQLLLELIQGSEPRMPSMNASKSSGWS
jgi:hypothetical protein